MRTVLAASLLILLAAVACGSEAPEPVATPEQTSKTTHCLSEDGHYDELITLVKEQGYDPLTFTVASSRFVGDAFGKDSIAMEFYAQTVTEGGRGNLIRHVAAGWIDHETCEAELLGIS